MVPEVGIAPTSPRLQRGANLPQLLGELVVPRGNAPRSPAYQAGALLLSYETSLGIGGWCRDCTHAARRLTRFSGPGHYCSANHPKWSGWQELHLRPPRSEQGRLLLTLHPEKWLPDLDSHQDKRLNRPPCYFDTTWQIGAAGRIPTCIVPFRRRMPHVFGHDSI